VRTFGENSSAFVVNRRVFCCAARVSFWPIASFRCAAEFSRYRGIADSGKPTARQIYGFTA
jgi:hypothetical protein